jgi:hypothetical protein
MMYACLKFCSSIMPCDAVVVLCCGCDVVVQHTLRVPVVVQHPLCICEEMLDSLETVLKERLGAETIQNLDSDAF